MYSIIPVAPLALSPPPLFLLLPCCHYYCIIENFERGTSIPFPFLHCRDISRPLPLSQQQFAPPERGGGVKEEWHWHRTFVNTYLIVEKYCNYFDYSEPSLQRYWCGGRNLKQIQYPVRNRPKSRIKLCCHCGTARKIPRKSSSSYSSFVEVVVHRHRHHLHHDRQTDRAGFNSVYTLEQNYYDDDNHDAN